MAGEESAQIHNLSALLPHDIWERGKIYAKPYWHFQSLTEFYRLAQKLLKF